MKEKQTVLVTGGLGFIGSHLVERLLGDGHDVTVLDVEALQAKKQNAWWKREIQYHRVDLSHHDEIKPVYFRGIDWVFHLAGMSDIVPSITKPRMYHEANVTGTLNLLLACRNAEVSRFIYSASSSCYGIPDVYPTPETVPMKPMYPYALTKYIGERYALHWCHVYKLPVVSLRLFNVYGPRSRVSADYGPVFSTFMAQKRAGKPFTVVGDGTQTRDFTYVSDIVSAFIAAALSNVTGESMNVGSGGTYSINHLIALLGGGTAVYIPKRPGEPDCTYADITKINRLLGWKPKILFEEGVKLVVQHIDSWKSAPVWTPKTIKRATKEWFRYLGKS